LDNVYERNLPLVRENLNRKQKQSIAAKSDPQAERKRKLMKKVPDSQQPHPAPRKRQPHPGPRQFVAREPNPQERRKTIPGARSATDTEGIQLRTP